MERLKLAIHVGRKISPTVGVIRLYRVGSHQTGFVAHDVGRLAGVRVERMLDRRPQRVDRVVQIFRRLITLPGLVRLISL